MTPYSPSNQDSLVEIPICVDLDGTLIQTDMLWVSCLGLLRKNVFYLSLLPWWLCRGKAHLKQQISNRVDVAIDGLPYNSVLIDFLHRQKASGRRIVLATATHQKFASAVAQHLEIFDEVIASDARNNLSGVAKRDRLVERFGRNRFDYAGNSRVDLKIWPHSRGAILVNVSRRVREQAEYVSNVVKIL